MNDNVEAALCPKYKSPVINYCLRNIDPETRCLLRQSGFYVIEDFCLHRCGQCYEGPFLVVDGQEITAGSHQAILEQVKKEIS